MGFRSVGLGWAASAVVLGFGAGPALAHTVTYHLAETSTWLDTASGGFDPYTPLPALLEGSFLTLDFEEGGGVSVAASSFRIHATRWVGVNIGTQATIETELVATLSGGAGVVLPLLIGVEFSVAPQFAIEGTVRCTRGACEALGFGAEPMAWEEWLDRNGLESVDPVAAIPFWQFGPGGILASLPVAQQPGSPSFFTSMIQLNGHAVPEPSSAALVALGLALGLRRFA